MNIKRIIAGLVITSMFNIINPLSCEAFNESQIKTHYVSTSRGLTLNREEFILLAKLIHAEARGESLVGQVAVGAVVFNRLKDPRFPKTIARIIYEDHQFSPVMDGSINLSPNEQALLAAELALNGMDPTRGSIFFYNPAKAESRWLDNLPEAIVIGSHVFIKEA